MKKQFTRERFFSIDFKKVFLLTAIAWVSVPALKAQSYYPGGLGNGNLLVWLNANKSSSITKNGSNQVSQWSDLSGNGYDFTQGTTSEKPVYGAAGSPSGMPALAFTSTSTQFMSTPNLPASISFTAGVSAFAVASYNATQTAQGWQRIFDFGNGSGNNNFMMGRYGSTGSTYYESWNGTSGDQTWTSTTPIVNGSENIYEAVQQGGTAATLTNVAHYFAGTAQAATGQAGSSQTYVPTSIARTLNYIGRSNFAADNYFSGTMSEVLVYNTAVNTTQRVILENYESAEWNQTVSVSKYTPPTTTTYTTNLVGIGYTSGADNFLADVAGSTDGLGFSSGSGATDFLHTAGYLMAAHNAQANTVITNATIPGITSASPISRWDRSWDVQMTGGNTAGAVTLNLNFSDYNGTMPSAVNTYSLLYNATDGTFATGTNKLVTVTSTTLSGNIVSFKLTASNLVNGYYTIVYSATTLPLELTAFTAVAQGSSSLLEWSAQEEIGFSHFEIERSSDGAQFSTIGAVTAAAYASVPGQYTYSDLQPLKGLNYYRLAMVDEDGTVAYSGIRTVNFGGSSDATVSVYPNPASDLLNLAFTHVDGTVSIRLFNSIGGIVRMMTTTSASIQVPVSDLARGVYVVEIVGTNFRNAVEFLKN
jgi:hypothetical protein